MQEHELFVVPRRLQAGLQPQQLPVHDLFVVFPALLLLVKPAPRAAERVVLIIEAVVVEDLQTVDTVFREKAVCLRRGAPPVVVIALDDDFSAGQAVEKQEILFRLLQVHPPAQVAAEHGGVLRSDGGKALFQFFDIIRPAAAEHVHGLLRAAEGEMRISDHV